MKKTISILLTALIAVTAASCSPKAPENQNIANGGSSTQTIDYENTIEFYGKTASVTGNEINLDLAKLPEAPEIPSSMNPDGNLEAVIMVPATAATPAEGGTGGAAQRIEPEYTGETKSFVIPAGIEVKDNATGAVKPLSEIKKGSLLSIRTDKDNNVVEVLYLG